MKARKFRPWPEIVRVDRGRDEVVITREIVEAAQALYATANDWLTFLPRAAAVENARTHVTGIGRLLAELAAYQEGSHE